MTDQHQSAVQPEPAADRLQHHDHKVLLGCVVLSPHYLRADQVAPPYKVEAHTPPLQSCQVQNNLLHGNWRVHQGTGWQQPGDGGTCQGSWHHHMAAAVGKRMSNSQQLQQVADRRHQHVGSALMVPGMSLHGMIPLGDKPACKVMVACRGYIYLWLWCCL